MSEHPTKEVDIELVEDYPHVSNQPPPTTEESKAVRWRIDLRLMPVMVMTYAIQYYDKSVLNQAALFGILKDLDLQRLVREGPPPVYSTQRYSYVGMIFYCGYVLGVYPATLLAQKYSAGKVCAGLVLVWGVVEILTVACSTFGGIMAQRFFLGFCEAGIAPAFVIACAQWYTQGESAFRIAIWWSSNGAVAMFAPLVSYGFGSIHGALRPWKNIYLWAGLMTFVWGWIVLWTLPDNPTKAKFLSDRERYVAIERVRDNNAGLVNHHIKWHHVQEAASDPVVLLLVTLMFGATSTNAITGNFASIIIHNLGFSTFQSLLLQIPTGFFGICVGLLPSLLVLKTNNWRLVIFSILATASLCGTAVLYAVPHTRTGIVLLGYYLNNFYVGCPNIILACSAANISGHTKRSTVNSMIFVAYCAGSIMSPLIFRAQDNFHSGFLAIMVCQVYIVVTAQIVHLLYRIRNKRRNRLYGIQKMGAPFTDETDFQNTNFRYAY